MHLFTTFKSHWTQLPSKTLLEYITLLQPAQLWFLMALQTPKLRWFQAYCHWRFQLTNSSGNLGFFTRKSSVLGCFLVLLSSTCVIHVRCGCSDPCHVSSSVAPTAAFSFQPLRSFTMDSAKYQQEILLVIIKWKKQKNIYQAPVEDKSSSCHEVSLWSAHKADTQRLSPVPVTSQSSHTHPLFTEQTLYISICFQNFTDPLQQNWPE